MVNFGDQREISFIVSARCQAIVSAAFHYAVTGAAVLSLESARRRASVEQDVDLS